MLKIALWHEPEYFGFYVKDPLAHIPMDPTEPDRVREHRFATWGGGVVVGVTSEFTAIPIAVEFNRRSPDSIDQSQWDRIIECSLETKTNGIAFEGSTGDEFGRLDVVPGRYRLRIHYGGQDVRKPDGNTGDFYLIQVWPSTDVYSRMIKPEHRE
jgi:hypothetical protein